MRALVVGGAGSGKSAFAEKLACTLGTKRTYLATMSSSGAEARARIKRHRDQRANLGFTTVECRGSVPHLSERSGGDAVILLDDLGNLVADALFLPDGTMCDSAQTLKRLANEVHALSEASDNLVVVGNSVGSAGPYADASTNEWVRVMGALCCQIAARFDVVIEVVFGRPHLVKGAL